jgi:hypothetical protein
MFDPANDPFGVYTYTVNGIAPCVAMQATVTISLEAQPDPGLPVAITVCSSDPSFGLFEHLGGNPDPGGIWSAPDGGPSTGIFDPSTSVPGVYAYTIQGLAPCPAVSATVTVNINADPDAGEDAAITLCISSPAIDLFNLLGGTPDAGGTWTAPDGGASGGSFDPAIDAAGGYSYTVGGGANCPADVATVIVNVSAEPDAGFDGDLAVCNGDPVFNLFAQLGGTPDAGGTWTAPDGTPFGGSFDPASDAPGIYTYSIDVPPPCVSVSSTVTVAINDAPDAGEDAAITLCISSPPTDLFSLLGGTPDAGGTWTAPDGSASDGTFDPAIDAPGGYSYTVGGGANCPADVATVTVIVSAEPDAGIDGDLSLCNGDPAVDLFSQLGGTPDAGGTWTAMDGTPSAEASIRRAMHRAFTFIRSMFRHLVSV